MKAAFSFLIPLLLAAGCQHTPKPQPPVTGAVATDAPASQGA